jgi:hypothetical protein
MASVQSIILTLAIAILLIILIVIGINISMSQNKQVWPPVTGDCPDYWIDQGKGGSQCAVNAKRDNIGLATSPMDFSLPVYSGSNGSCIKYTWANTNKVSWDGITYGVPNPCIKK